MKKTWKIALAAAVLTGSAHVAHAGNTVFGPTGLFLNPTAQVAAKGAPEVAVNYLRISPGEGHINLPGIAGAVGVADKLELNGGYHRISGTGSSSLWNVGAKYQIAAPAGDKIGLAVGADYTKWSGDGHYRTDVYGVATKVLNSNSQRPPILGNLGLRYNDHRGSGGRADVFAGLAVPITQSGELYLVGELGSKRGDSDKSEYALGLSYTPKGKSINIAGGIARDIVVVQVGYKFGQ